MSRGLNKVMVIGNLGRDPEMRYLPSGGAVATLAIATSESWKGRLSGEMVEKTEWHRVVAFNRLAEVVRDYVRKGSKVYIEGKLRTNKWQDKQGNDRYTTEIIANDMQMLDSRNNAAQEPQQQNARPDTGDEFIAGVAANAEAMLAPNASSAKQDELDDDIPF